MASSGEDNVDALEAPFLARLNSAQQGAGAQAGLWKYGFVEQVFDPTSGVVRDASAPRTDNLATAGNTFAVEVCNQYVPGLPTSPPANPPPALASPLPSPLPYNFVKMKLKGGLNGGTFYEFVYADALVYLTITSSASQTITLIDGISTAIVYPAVVIRWQNGTWTQTTQAAWLSVLWPGGTLLNNSAEPFPAYAFPCRLLGADNGTPAVAVYGAVAHGVATGDKNGNPPDALFPFTTALQADKNGVVQFQTTAVGGKLQVNVVGPTAGGGYFLYSNNANNPQVQWFEVFGGGLDLLDAQNFAPPPQDGKTYYLTYNSGTVDGYNWTALPTTSGTITYVKSVNFGTSTVTTGTITVSGGFVTAFT